MRRLAILAAASLLSVAAAACDDTRVITRPDPIPVPTASPTPGTGGPCGDGTILRPGQHCP